MARRSTAGMTAPTDAPPFAWCTETEIAIGQVKTEEKSNEITAIPNLLETLDLLGAIVTIDAMGCQKRIADATQERKGDYLLAAKDNQPTLTEAIRVAFDKRLEASVTIAARALVHSGRAVFTT